MNSEKQDLTHEVSPTTAQEECLETKSREDLASLLMRIATAYINPPFESIDDCINISLTEVGEYLGCDRVYIFEYDFVNRRCSNTHEWCAPAIRSQKHGMQGIPIDWMPSWAEAHQQGCIVAVEDVAQLPQGSEIQRLLVGNGTQSFMLVPLRCDGKCRGFFGFDRVREPKKFCEHEREMLTLFAQMVVHLQNRRFAVLELKETNERLAEQTRIAEQLALEAKRANESKNAFLATMSHEIRTPINSVIGMTSMLFNTHLQEDQLEFVQTIRSSSDLLLFQVNDVLDFSKIESRNITLEREEFDLAKTLTDPITMLGMKAREKNLRVTCCLAPDLPARLTGDEVRLKQILLNLLGNAMKFTPDSGLIQLQANGFWREPNTWVLQVSVSDNGVGIANYAQSRIFEPFFQANPGDPSRLGGSGLGLAISKRLALFMGGSLHCESAEGEGSTFYLSVPLHAERKTLSIFDAPASFPSLREKRILVVEPEPSLCSMLAGMLRGAGAIPIEASNTTIAYESGLQSMPHFMLVSDSVSDVSPLGFLESAQRSLFGHIPTILLTNKNTNSPDAVLHSRFSRVLNHPLSQSSLLDALQLAAFPLSKHPKTSKNVPDEFALDPETADRWPIRILIAEDHVMNQRVIRHLLGKLGYEPTIAADGQLALDEFRSGEWDLILMDLEMPRMDGFEATRQIRRMEETTGKHCHIAALTANVMADCRERCTLAGMDGYLSKPLRIPDLLHVIERAFARRESDRDDGESSDSSREPNGAELYHDTATLLDRDHIHALIGGDSETTFMPMLLQGFGARFESTLADLEKACLHKDTSSTRRILHFLRGTTANAGMSALANEIKTIHLALHEKAEFPSAEALNRMRTLSCASLESYRNLGLVPRDYTW